MGQNAKPDRKTSEAASGLHRCAPQTTMTIKKETMKFITELNETEHLQHGFKMRIKCTLWLKCIFDSETLNMNGGVLKPVMLIPAC